MKSTPFIKVAIDYGFGPEAIKEVKLKLIALSYQTTDTLAVEAIDENGETFADITVCLGQPLMPGFAFIDTNNCRWAEEMLRKNGIAKPARNGACMASGYCTYPLYEFDMSKFSEEFHYPGEEEQP